MMILIPRRYWRLTWPVLLMGGTVLFVWQHVYATGQSAGVKKKLKTDLYQLSATNNSSKEKPQTTSNTNLIYEPLLAVHNRRSPKVYVYTLPPKFNLDIQNCASYMKRCLRLRNGGFGDPLYREGDLYVYGTDQFSLEVIIHHQLLTSKYRTEHPEEADVFYIPAYLGTHLFCGSNVPVENLQDEMFRFIKSMPYFEQGKPHLSALAKIEREQSSPESPILRNLLCRKVTYLVIEKESKAETRKNIGLEKQRVIVAPYPSYGHFDSKLAGSQSINTPSLESRTVFMFLAASDRRSNHFRASILDQMSTTVKDTRFSQFIDLNIKGVGPRQIWLNTQECLQGHVNITIEWMQNSVFCLQPHGDSPTRKSFYDSIVSGCIPVIFTFPEEDVVYPFQRVLNYSDFIVSIDAARVEKHHEFVLNILKDIPHSEIVRLHSNVVKVARMLQYSFIDEKEFERYYDTPYVDALDMIMDEVKYEFGIEKKELSS